MFQKNVCANGTNLFHSYEFVINELKKSYAFSEWKGLDFKKLKAIGANQVKEAEKKYKQGRHDEAFEMFRDAVLRLAASIPDGHVSADLDFTCYDMQKKQGKVVPWSSVT